MLFYNTARSSRGWIECWSLCFQLVMYGLWLNWAPGAATPERQVTPESPQLVIDKDSLSRSVLLKKVSESSKEDQSRFGVINMIRLTMADASWSTWAGSMDVEQHPSESGCSEETLKLSVRLVSTSGSPSSTAERFACTRRLLPRAWACLTGQTPTPSVSTVSDWNVPTRPDN